MAVRRRGGKNGLFGNLSPSTRRRLVEGDGEGPGTRWRFAFLYYNNPTARQKRRKIVQTVFLHHKAERLESPFADLKTPTTAMNDRAPLLLSEEQWPIALGSVARRDSSKTETMTRVVGLQRENARGAVEYVRRPQAKTQVTGLEKSDCDLRMSRASFIANTRPADRPKSFSSRKTP